MKKKTLLISLVVFIILLLGFGSFFVCKNYFTQKSKEQTNTQVKSKILKLDLEKEATHLSQVAGTKGVYWMRGMPIIWNDVEKEKGEYNWEVTDGHFLKGYFKGNDNTDETYHLAMIWPYVNWDQKACHSGEKYKATGHLKESGEDLLMGSPCDMSAYSDFLSKVVERYDGDGNDDMPGLETPVKYWEIMNEPEMQGGSTGGAGEDLKFFVGSSEEYLQILKTSYEAIKKADPKAKVAHAGMAGMQQNFQDFWNPVFSNGGGNYFDITNIHTISTDEKREDLYVLKFKRYLEKFNIKNKPIWITEVQFGSLMDKPKDVKSFEKLLVKASVFSLAMGADKLFYIENWSMWDNKELLIPLKDDKDKDKKEPPKIDLTKNSTHKVYLNLVNKINRFEKIEALKEKYHENSFDHDGATSEIGHYKFINKDKVIYVLWGKNSAVVSEITGELKVTDIYGVSKEINSSELEISDEPIFVELIK